MFISVSVYFYVLESQLVSETKVTERYTLHNYKGGEWRLHTLYTEVAHTMVGDVYSPWSQAFKEGEYVRERHVQAAALFVCYTVSLSLCVCAGEQ